MSKSVTLVFLFVGLTSPKLSAAGQSRSAHPSEVIATYDDRSFANPERLPANVLAVLIRQKEASSAQDWAKEHPGGDLNRFFRAIRVQLTPSGGNDWIVNGVFPLTGADCDWFWIIRGGPSGPRVILFFNGDIVDLLEKQTKGLRDIRATWESPSERDISLYQYDGIDYRLIKRYSKAR